MIHDLGGARTPVELSLSRFSLSSKIVQNYIEELLSQQLLASCDFFDTPSMYPLDVPPRWAWKLKKMSLKTSLSSKTLTQEKILETYAF